VHEKADGGVPGGTRRGEERKSPWKGRTSSCSLKRGLQEKRRSKGHWKEGGRVLLKRGNNEVELKKTRTFRGKGKLSTQYGAKKGKGGRVTVQRGVNLRL